MKKISFKKLMLLCLLISIFVGEAVIAQAATDKKAPKITYSFSTKEATNGTVKITIKVTDSSKISSVKWASGSQKAAYFKEKGKNQQLLLQSKRMVPILFMLKIVRVIQL